MMANRPPPVNHSARDDFATRRAVAKAFRVWHRARMKFFFIAALLLAGFAPALRAQQTADDKYVGIYTLIEQANAIAEKGNSAEAAEALADAQGQLLRFQKNFPEWNPEIVNFRLNQIAEKIAALKNLPTHAVARELPAVSAPATNAPVSADASLQLPTETDNLRTRLQSAQIVNELLQAKLKEALSVQPAAADPRELDSANEKIRALMKENDLLKAGQAAAAKPAVVVTNFTPVFVTNLVEVVRTNTLLTIVTNVVTTVIAETNAPEAPQRQVDDEVSALRARLAVAEAQPVPYSAEELALLKAAAPSAEKIPAAEPPAETAELAVDAQRHFARQEFTDAETDYLKILERDPTNGIALANLATIELQENKLAEAELHVTAALAQSPNDAYDLSTLGYLKFRQEKYGDALNALSRAAQIDSENPEIQNYLGVTLSHQGQRKAAEAALRRAIQLNPNYAPAHNNLAVIYLNQEPPLAALARWHYQKAIDAGQPRNADLEKLLADKGAPVAQ
jgi:tetratricopeptide (TPR) repeat protein